MAAGGRGMRLAPADRVAWGGADDNSARGRVIDHCMLCSEAVHEGQESVHFFGLYVHLPCYRRETNFPDHAIDDHSTTS
jgi:hypothetical protein